MFVRCFGQRSEIMDIVITGRHLDVSDELDGFIRERVGKLDRFAERLHGVSVVIESLGDRNRVEMSIGATRGKRFVAEATAASVHGAVKIVEARIEAQLRRFKERLHGRRKDGAAVTFAPRSEPLSWDA
jgi:putative sigma-54 modulation protein